MTFTGTCRCILLITPPTHTPLSESISVSIASCKFSAAKYLPVSQHMFGYVFIGSELTLRCRQNLAGAWTISCLSWSKSTPSQPWNPLRPSAWLPSPYHATPTHPPSPSLSTNLNFNPTPPYCRQSSTRSFSLSHSSANPHVCPYFRQTGYRQPTPVASRFRRAVCAGLTYWRHLHASLSLAWPVYGWKDLRSYRRCSLWRIQCWNMNRMNIYLPLKCFAPAY